MRQYRLRSAMFLIGIIAISIALGIYFERARQEAARASRGVVPKPIPLKVAGPGGRGRAFTYFIGEFW